MSGFRILPVPETLAAEVRATLRTPDWGYPATSEVAVGYGPCRTCLRLFEIGKERRILFTHDPFAGLEPYPLPGPVFIHESPCEPLRDTSTLPDELRRVPMTLNGYARGRRLRAQEHIGNRRFEDVVARVFSDPMVEYIHVRNTDVGCFLVQLDREPAPESVENARSPIRDIARPVRCELAVQRSITRTWMLHRACWRRRARRTRRRQLRV